MAFALDRDVSNAVLLGPAVGGGVVTPNVVEPLKSVCSSESAKRKVFVSNLNSSWCVIKEIDENQGTEADPKLQICGMRVAHMRTHICTKQAPHTAD